MPRADHACHERTAATIHQAGGAHEAPGTVAPGSEGAAEVYRACGGGERAHRFTENPIGAMAQAVDTIGKAAGGVFAARRSRVPTAARGGRGQAQGGRRGDAGRIPARSEAKQKALVAAMRSSEQMGHLPPNDPRRLSVAIVRDRPGQPARSGWDPVTGHGRGHARDAAPGGAADEPVRFAADMQPRSSSEA